MNAIQRGFVKRAMVCGLTANEAVDVLCKVSETRYQKQLREQELGLSKPKPTPTPTPTPTPKPSLVGKALGWLGGKQPAPVVSQIINATTPK